MKLRLWKIALTVLIHIYFIASVAATVRQLPHCIENSNPGLILVSTLDGKLSALNTTGSLSWQIPTDPGSLLKSNVHNLQLSNNGEWVQIIPSLTGSLYKFNGKTIDAIPINAESLLKSSFIYSDDIVIAGGKEVRTYGVGLHTGHILYTCSLEGCQNKTQYDGEIDDVVIIERNTLTIRAHEPRMGSERWNFSVGHHNIKIPHHECANLMSAHIDFNITAIPPEGLIKATKIDDNVFLWERKFESPIVDIWIYDGKDLRRVNTFDSAAVVQNDVKTNPLIYLAMHNKQLYIHESQRMLKFLQYNRYSESEVVESKGVLTIPWKPVLASRSVLGQNTNDFDKSTAVSVLYGSEYVNGNGFYLYNDPDMDDEDGYAYRDNLTDAGPLENGLLLLWPLQWHWTIHLTIITAICIAYFLCNFETRGVPGFTKQCTTKSVENAQEAVNTPSLQSHYESNFVTLGCLGKGGFGVVFEAKQKIDECRYAIKRITFYDKESRELVLREARALANLDHKNIVRYFNSWVEEPASGCSYEYDKDWLNEYSFVERTPVKMHKRSNSTIIDMRGTCETESSGGIVFQNEIPRSSNEPLSRSVSFAELSTGVSIKKLPLPPISTTSNTHSNSIKETFLETNPTYLYIQMQLCQAESLSEWLLKNSEERNKKSVLIIFQQIIDAVAYVHSKNFIHRDLKPSNIFFSLDGYIKIGDFGLVTTMNHNCDPNLSYNNSSLQSHTRGVGTKLYMSPEQIQKKQYNFKVDVYSLGVILFELLVPFSTDSERIKTLTDLREGKYPPDFAEIHKDVFGLLECMLSTNPKERPMTEEIKASLFS